jgi:imidazolonepropionase-like amidohydrolase
MDLWLRDMTTNREERLTTLPGAEVGSAWSYDGTRVAFLRDSDSLSIVSVNGTHPISSRSVLHEPGAPSWSPDGRWIVLSSLVPNSTRFREGTNQVLRLSVSGSPDQWFDPVPHTSIGMRGDYGPVWSPDGTRMAAIVDGHLVTFPVNSDGQPTGPTRELSTDLAESPTWTGDSRRILYQTDNRLRLVDVIDGSVRDIDPGLTWTSATPLANRATIVHAGRLWDGTSAAVRADMDIVLDGTRIKSVEPHRAALHTGNVVDGTNATVIPGLIEIHSHLVKAYGEALGRIWLSWGITTVRSPAGNPFEDVEQREAVESGVRIGPRTFMAGEPIDGTRIYYPGGASVDEGSVEIGQQLERATRLGYDFMKTYVRLPDLIQKRVVEEAHRRGLSVTSHELYPAVAFGADGVEHVRGTSRRGYSPKQSQLNRTYGDVVSLLAASQMTITPTVGIQGGFQLQTIRDASWLNDPRMSLYPASVLASWRTVAAQPRNQADIDRRLAMTKPVEKAVFDIVKAGGRVTAGTDAPINPYGLSLLMELEQYVAGGLTPLQALQSATTVNARALGMENDLGAIAPGRLADLVILDGNPLTNIRDLRRVRSVVKDGGVYTLESLLKRP